MTVLSDGMRRLIEPWTLTVTVGDAERTQHFPPLVDMLADMVAPSSGRTVGGANDPARKSVINVFALDLRENIEDITQAWLREWGVQIAGELKLDLRGFWDRLHALHDSGALDTTTFEHLVGYADTWGGKIWDQYDPPFTLSLRGIACPKCGESKFTNMNSETVDNLAILWRESQEPTAECQHLECAAIWIGDKGLEDLGEATGMDIDVVALREWRLEKQSK